MHLVPPDFISSLQYGHVLPWLSKRVQWQCLHLIASSRIIFSQYGQCLVLTFSFISPSLVDFEQNKGDIEQVIVQKLGLSAEAYLTTESYL